MFWHDVEDFKLTHTLFVEKDKAYIITTYLYYDEYEERHIYGASWMSTKGEK